ncbi:DUF4132 domain-containing protein [Streptomyces sp. NPDC054945]
MVPFVDETTAGGPGDGWTLDMAEERLALRELIRRRVFQEVAEYHAKRPEVFHGLPVPRPPAGRDPGPAAHLDRGRHGRRLRGRAAAHPHRRPLDQDTAQATVELWHPVGREPAEVVAWRNRLERCAVTQPFKQAHREVCLLTDAERHTRTYSNRFAAHVLRRHQFHSPAAARGWRNRLRLCVDDCAPPAVRELPRWGLRAEYWIEGEGREYGVDTTESGSYLRLRTDQVRFYPIDAPQNEASTYGGEYTMGPRDGRDPVHPLPLMEIPALVLSEVLRDVDLFVGVASVGNDPTWSDGGPEGRFRAYWASYGFGELNQSARAPADAAGAAGTALGRRRPADHPRPNERPQVPREHPGPGLAALPTEAA